MYKNEDLFNNRVIVGAKLEKYIENNRLKKVDICNKAKISRPTLDKLLKGQIENKVSFEKHIKKILSSLSLTPDILMGPSNTYNISRLLRSFWGFNLEEFSEMTGISKKRIEDIEMGAEPKLSELRDMALYLSTSTNVIRGKNFFDSQISVMEDFNLDTSNKKFSGFWGHVGISLKNHDIVKWYPITYGVKRYITVNMGDVNRLVIPCMNNRVLFINMDYINEIFLLDEACDAPCDLDWRTDVSEGEIPLAVYEILSDYGELYIDEIPGNELSCVSKEFVSRIARKQEWEEDDIYPMMYGMNIYYSNGKTRETLIDFSEDENISDEVFFAYTCEEFAPQDDILMFTDMGEMEVCLNWNNVEMLDLPYIELENKIMDKVFDED